jgi:hypothetical protein
MERCLGKNSLGSKEGWMVTWRKKSCTLPLIIVAGSFPTLAGTEMMRMRIGTPADQEQDPSWAESQAGLKVEVEAKNPGWKGVVAGTGSDGKPPGEACKAWTLPHLLVGVPWLLMKGEQ